MGADKLRLEYLIEKGKWLNLSNEVTYSITA
jgi:hypothetical protein